MLFVHYQQGFFARRYEQLLIVILQKFIPTIFLITNRTHIRMACVLVKTYLRVL